MIEKERNLKMLKTLLEKRDGSSPEDIVFSTLGETEIVSKQLICSVKDLTVTIRPNSIQFSTSSVRYFSTDSVIKYVLLSIEKGKKWLIVSECSRDTVDAQRWCTEKDGKLESRKLTGDDFPNRMYTMMNWNKGFYYKAFGYLGAAIDEDYKPFLAYKLEKTRGIALSTKARQDAKIKDADVGEEMLAKIMEHERKQEEERKEAKKRGEKFTPKPLVLLNGIAEDSFGVLRKNQKEENELPGDVEEFFKRNH